MNDITDQDRRIAREWATTIGKQIAGHPDARTAARVILATVDAPEPTLTEELRDVADNYGMSSRAADRLHDIADRMEHDLTEARAEVERLAAERDGARDEIAWLRNGPGHTEVATDLPNPADAQKAAESTAETPTPADVQPGEAWLVQVGRETRTAVKDTDAGIPWNTVNHSGVFHAENDDDVTLLARLVPVTRPDPEEHTA